MPSTGTYEIAKHMTPMKVFTFIHKEYSVEEHKINLAMMKEQAILKKTDGKKIQSLKGVPKLEDAEWAGTKKLCEAPIL